MPRVLVPNDAVANGEAKQLKTTVKGTLAFDKDDSTYGLVTMFAS